MHYSFSFPKINCHNSQIGKFMVLHLFVSTFEIAVKVQNEFKRKSRGDEFDACVLYISYGDRVHVSVLSNRHRLCGDDRIISFNKTVFCNSEPISGKGLYNIHKPLISGLDFLQENDSCTVRFSICAVNFDANQSRYVMYFTAFCTIY